MTPKERSTTARALKILRALGYYLHAQRRPKGWEARATCQVGVAAVGGFFVAERESRAEALRDVSQLALGTLYDRGQL